MELPISANSKGNSYNLIFFIINRLIKNVYYKLVKVTINILNLTKLIINIIMYYYNIYELIITDQSLLFKFIFNFYYITF